MIGKVSLVRATNEGWFLQIVTDAVTESGDGYIDFLAAFLSIMIQQPFLFVKSMSPLTGKIGFREVPLMNILSLSAGRMPSIA